MTLIPNSLDELRSGIMKDASREDQIDSPDYDDLEKTYLGGLRRRLTTAKNNRDTNHDAYDGMTYLEWCESNRRGATSYIKPRNNRQETNFTTGTTRQKLMIQLANLINLNLEPDITAFNHNDLVTTQLGEGMENILEKSREIDGDEEKKLMRQYTLMEQGEVFVEVMWKKGFELKKTLENFKEGQFKNVKIRSRLKKALGKLTSTVIRNEKVYKGDMTQPIFADQPFIFTAERVPYNDLEPMFKDFDMWKYVAFDMKHLLDQTADNESGYVGAWNIGEYKKGFVEVIKYQSQVDNEFQLTLNGIPMLPIGYPLTEVSPAGEYMIDGQIFSIIDSHFSGGKSLISILKTSQALEDEFWKLVMLSEQQKLTPPMINNTGRVLSSRAQMPGVVTANIPFDKFKPLLEGKGITQSEIAVLDMLRSNLEDNSTDKQFGGKAPEGDPTATEISVVQSQAEKLLGLTIFPAALLEKKLADHSIPILLKHWFDPVDTVIDGIKGSLKETNVFRRSNLEKSIDGQGVGQEIVEVTDKPVPSPFEIFEEENKIFEQTGIPTRKIVLNRDDIMRYKYTFRTSVVPTPKKSSNLQKRAFQEEVATFSLSPNFSMDWFEENAAITYGRNPQKVFARQGGPVDPALANSIQRPGGAGDEKTTLDNSGAGGKV